jgi:hypothetical protein
LHGLHEPPQSAAVSSTFLRPSTQVVGAVPLPELPPLCPISLIAHELPLKAIVANATTRIEAPTAWWFRTIGRFSLERRFTRAAEVTK